MQQKLSHLGQAKVTSAIVNGKQFYRVRVGPVPDVAHADSLLNQIKSAGIAAPRTLLNK